jgi:hypothetical protein
VSLPVDTLVNNAASSTLRRSKISLTTNGTRHRDHPAAAFHAINTALPGMKARKWGASSTSPPARPRRAAAKNECRRQDAWSA